MAWCCPDKYLRFFKAIHDKHRQGILMLIKKHKEINASQIIKKIQLSQPTTSHHLKILTDSGAIIAIKKGKEMYYSINTKHIANCCMNFSRMFSAA